MKAILTGLVISLAALPAGICAAAEAGDVENGRLLARQICGDCHAVRRDEISSPNRNAPSFEDIAATPALTPVALRVALQSSHREMSNIVLTDAELDQVVAYILSLAKR
jgi:mono/diheme cytochrome c family protein